MGKQRTETPLSVQELSIIAMFAANTALLAQIAIPLTFTAVPIPFGLVAAYISGILLEAKHAVYSQICYLLLDALGVPVFSNFRGGMGVLLGPTGNTFAASSALAVFLLRSERRSTMGGPWQ